MIKYIVLLIIFSSSNIFGGWEICNKGLPSLQISALHANGKIVLIGSRDSLYRSTDNGNEWIPIARIRVEDFFEKNDSILAVGFDGVYLSTNFGQSWKKQSNKIIRRIIESNNLLIGASPGGFDGGGVLKSTNFGSSWFHNSLSDESVWSLKSIDNRVYAGTLHNGIYVSTNLGYNWDKINNGMVGPPYYLIHCIEGNGFDLWAGADGKAAFYSSDMGESWVQKANGVNFSTSFFDLLNYNSIIIAGTYGKGVLYFDSIEDKWLSLNNSDSLDDRIISTLAINNTYLFAGTMYGNLYRIELDEITTVEDITENPLIIFPNPVSENLKISNYEGKLSIINSLGVEVWKGVVREKESVDISKLPIGYYLLMTKNKVTKFVKI